MVNFNNQDQSKDKHGQDNLAYKQEEAEGHVELREVGRAYQSHTTTTVNGGRQSKNACKAYLIFVIILCIVIGAIVGITIGIDQLATDGEIWDNV